MGATVTLLGQLASGGMGYVELVAHRDQRFLRLYARKRLHIHLRRDPAFLAMFMDEARLSGLIRHPNVVSVLDVGADAEGPFLLMELVEGQSLSRVVKTCAEQGRRVPIQLCVRIALDIARGLHAAHEALDPAGQPLGLVHRDVSAQNVLVSYDGVVKVSDFGIAKAFGNVTETATGVLKGSMGYLSPEQLRFHEPDRRSDLFALGVLIYELLATERLYANTQGLDGPRRILEEPPPDVGAARQDTPPALVELVFRLLAKEPELRPAAAEDVAIRLEDVLTALVDAEGTLSLGSFMQELFSAERQAQKVQIESALKAFSKTESRPRRGRYLGLASMAVGLAVGIMVWVLGRGGTPVPGQGRTLWAGGWHTCARDGNSLYCWGKNNQGQAGTGEMRDEVVRQRVQGVDRPASVALGLFHSCACSETGVLSCWGRGAEGQVGAVGPDRRSPQITKLSRPCRTVAAGPRHTCVLLQGGQVACFGENLGGESGQPPSPRVPVPTLIPDLKDVVELVAGGDNRNAPSGFTCARRKDGAVLCWGDNEFGQLGDPSLPFGPTPRIIAAATGAQELAAGGSFGCARMATGSLSCWGSLYVVNDLVRKGLRVDVAPLATGLADVVQMTAGLAHGCALHRSGGISCFGDNSHGQLALTTAPGQMQHAMTLPHPAQGLVIAAGQVHTCVRHATGISCFGRNQTGQLGMGTTDDSAVPVSVAGFSH